MEGPVTALYLHIPFCERKCQYCDFVSVAGTAREDAYIDALVTEIERLAVCDAGPFTTVFIGGGTPGLVDPANIARLLDTVATRYGIDATAEVTIEANPSSTSVERAREWRAAGVNRVSLGVQSLEPDPLTFLGRVHDADRAVGAVAEVRAAGFESVNCDLIYGIPGVTAERWAATLERVAALGPDHISCYELTVEEGTPLHRLVAQGRVVPVDADAALEQHWTAVDILGARGYPQYEVSNFARPGCESRHNLVYWRNGFYLAAGVGAHGHLPPTSAARLGLDTAAATAGIRYWHHRNIERYISAVERGELGVAATEAVTHEARRDETIMLGLRLAEGIDAALVDAGEVDALLTSGLVDHHTSGRVRVTRRGQEVLNAVALRCVAANTSAGAPA